MKRTIELTALLAVDTLAICLSVMGLYSLRVLMLETETGSIYPIFALIGLLIYWGVLLWLNGHYQHRQGVARFDESLSMVKVNLVGALVLFFLVLGDDLRLGNLEFSGVRFIFAVYLFLNAIAMVTGRLLVRSWQRRRLRKGFDWSRTLIVGIGEEAQALYGKLKKFPAMGFNVLGFIPAIRQPEAESLLGVPVYKDLDQLPEIIEQENIGEVIIALPSEEHQTLLKVLGLCEQRRVNLKIVPDLYDIVSGQARTNQIYGLPLIAIHPDLMAPWAWIVKRIMDLLVAVLGILVTLPLQVLLAILIRLESSGPVIYSQIRSGRNGKPFRIYKFRSMTADAEKAGAQWAKKEDPRVTRIGRWLRKTRLDEIPQFYNILLGDMSMVGPRPERPEFVARLKKTIPLYSRRLLVRPGITGWAQVKHKYDESLDDVKLKVQFDLFYIENISLKLDLQILVQTIGVILSQKGH